MKERLKKLFQNEMFVGIACAVGCIILIGAIILTAVLLTRGNQTTGKNTDSTFSFAVPSDEEESSKEESSGQPSSQEQAAQTSSKTSSSSKQNSSKQTSSKEQVSSQAPLVEPPKANANDYKAMAKQNTYRAKLLARTYMDDFYDPQTFVQFMEYPFRTVGVTTAWEYGAMMSMQTMMAKIDKSEISLMNNVIEGMQYYGRKKNGELEAYVVHRGDFPMGASDEGLAYDDNIWIAINYIQAYQNTGNKTYLSQAEHIMNYLWEEAWFEPLGGFFWDYRKQARHSCSNNPAIKPYVDLYKLTGKKQYLDRAKQVFEFSYNALKDKKLNIYEDLVGARQENGKWVEGSSAGTGFYSYNTGAMISGASALYSVTKDKKYLDEALACAEGAYEYFGVKNQVKGYVGWPYKRENGSETQIWFNVILLRGYIDLYEVAPQEATKYILMFQNSIDYAFTHYLDGGYLPYDWLGGWHGKERDRYKRALDHSSNVEIYAMLADWQSRRK